MESFPDDFDQTLTYMELPYITWFHRIAALKLAKECNEALFKLTAEGPSVMYAKLLEERLERIESREINR